MRVTIGCFVEVCKGTDLKMNTDKTKMMGVRRGGRIGVRDQCGKEWEHVSQFIKEQFGIYVRLIRRILSGMLYKSGECDHILSVAEVIA